VPNFSEGRDPAKVDAIVNAANGTLLGGGGVDGAIHRGAGPKLIEECRSLGGCETGQAKITKGYRLPAKYVVHTVGPIWRGGAIGEDGLLRDSYLNSLRLADTNQVKSIAFPSISTGAYGFPITRAAKIACTTIREYLTGTTGIEEVVLVCFSRSDFDTYKSVIGSERVSVNPSRAP
jgi:O-acetyl-ADP-ribose deacetylase (regulator of RNase III)